MSRRNHSSSGTHEGFTIKPGEQLRDLVVTINDGAAELQGDVTGTVGGLLERIKIIFIPAERERADNPLCHAETWIASDGSFALENLAPERYWVVVKLLATRDVNSPSVKPVFSNRKERDKLRQEAEAKNVVIELRRCQQMLGYHVVYVPASSAH